MDETPAELLEQIESARHTLDQDLSALERRLHHDTNWRVQAKRHPKLATGVIIVCALIAGITAASLARLFTALFRRRAR